MRTSLAGILAVGVGVCVGACSDPRRSDTDGAGGEGGGGNGGQGGGGGGGGGGGAAGGGGLPAPDPKTCEAAAATHSYIGCDYWPVTLANTYSQDFFDFAVVVANASDEPATVDVTGGALAGPVTEIVPPGELRKVYLPWVMSLKRASEPSVIVRKGAYHLVSSRPVTVYQFNPLEYESKGGPPDKDWGSCKGIPCLSQSNDASLLIPSTAMTGNYRVIGHPGDGFNAPYFVVTATADATTVELTLGPKGSIAPGGGVPAAAAGATVSFTLDAGDVAHVPIPSGRGVGSDVSGSRIQADKPVQLMSGHPCTTMPLDVSTCDHLEETLLPTETLGRQYVITVPTGPLGKPASHVVRLYAGESDTALVYAPKAPTDAPDVLAAGDFVDLGLVDFDFQVTGDKAFGVATFMPGQKILDTAGWPSGLGDPSQTVFASVEQYRKRSIFLAPDDYLDAYADIVAPKGAMIMLNGAPVTAAPVPLDGADFNVVRVKLTPGVQKLESAHALGLQVIGYGHASSYQFPAGFNLRRIGTAGP